MSEANFLTQCGWADARKIPLAGDASSRKYTRLTRPSGTAILMDEGPGSSEPLNRFANIARHLKSVNLSAPEILAGGSDQYLLLEDLGDAVFARVVEAQPELETTLYQAAVDALIASQKTPIPKFIPPYGAAEMTGAVALAFEWYPTPKTAYPQKSIQNISDLFLDLLTAHLTDSPVLIQRDFHAENLIWLPYRNGPARVGLLDFQDAVFGDPAYDLASLLVDARRDISTDLKREMMDYYLRNSDTEPTAFQTAFALCSAQRNLRILGVFSRLAFRDGKLAYVDLMQRVWSNLQDDLTHPVLAELRSALSILPKPTKDILDSIGRADV